MLNIEIQRNLITMKGHADYAKRGQDIVCASASAVLLFASEMLKEHSPSADVEIKSGDAKIIIYVATEETDFIIENFERFMKQLGRQYPKHIKVFGGIINE